MEQVSNEDYHRTKGQHTTNATRISNEILIPSQENIPIFFIANCRMNEDDLQYLLTNTVFNEKTMKNYFEEIKEKMKQAKNLITAEKGKINKPVSQKEEEFDDYEEQRKKADDENTIIDKKNEHIEILNEMIRTISYMENDFTGPPKNLDDIFQQFKNFCEMRQSGKKFCTDNRGDSDMQNPIEGENSKNKEINKEIGSDDDRRLVDEQSANTDDNKMSVNNEENEILKKQLDNIIEDLKKIWGKLNDYNKSLGKTSKDNNDGINQYHSKSKDQSSSLKKGDYKNIDKNNEEMSEYIENQLNDIVNNIEEFNKYSSEYRSFLTEYFQYILQLLNNMNNIVWTGDLTKYSLEETSNFPAIPDKLIEEINFIEIESFNVLLIFLLLIKIFIGKIIEVKENKYSAWLRYIKLILFVKDHHKENMEILNNNLINMKLFDKFKQIKLIKCERNTKYSKSESDSLENENKLNILNEAEEKINNLMEELEKNI